MSEQPSPAADGLPYHTSPLRHLVKHVLHKDRALREHVTRLRWKRKRAKSVEGEGVPVEVVL